MDTQKQSFDALLVSSVDDDVSVGRSTRRLLRSAGLRSEAFASADEFLASGLAEETACLILDLRMPGMNGLQLQAHLAGVSNNVPIIFLSAHSSADEERRALAAGAVRFLQKPVNKEVLLNAIHEVLQSRKNISREHMKSMTLNGTAAASPTSRVADAKIIEWKAGDHPDMTSDATIIMAAADLGKPKATEELLVMVYDELRRLAAAKLAQEAPGQTLQPTALVHEAWIRLVGRQPHTFNDRAHFFRTAAEVMRRIIIDRARRKRTQKHGGGFHRVELEVSDPAAPEADDQLLAVNDALDKLALEHPVQAELVKLRYFAGMTNEEAAKVMGISITTVKNYWAFSRAWLLNEINSG